MKTLITLLILVASPLAARAQSVNLGALDERTNLVSVTTGAEHGLVVGTGYQRVLATAERPILVGGDLTICGADADLGDVRARAGAIAPIASYGAWKLAGGLAAIVRGTKSDIARMVDVGADATLLLGRYTRRWFAAAELGFDWAIATHITPTEDYRMNVYPDARTGWYGNTGGVLRGGVQAGLSVGRADVILRAGKLVDVAGDPTMFPIYATLGVDTHW